MLSEWGAWRAGLAETMEAARHDGELGNSRRILTAINAVCAAGWSRRLSDPAFRANLLKYVQRYREARKERNSVAPRA